MAIERIGRRTWLASITAWVAARRLASAGTQAAAWRGAVLQADEGEHLISGRRRAPMRIKIDSRAATSATMSMLVSEVSPGANIPVHLHRNEDELIFIHAGSGIVTLGEQRVASKTGAVLYAPRNQWHGVENTGNDTLIWCAITPRLGSSSTSVRSAFQQRPRSSLPPLK
jgi:quercetin dioxygenase-like cupin family protein